MRNRLNYIQKRVKEEIEKFRGAKKLSKLSGCSTEDLMASNEGQRFLMDGKESWLAAAYECMEGNPALEIEALNCSLRPAVQPRSSKRLRSPTHKFTEYRNATAMRKSTLTKRLVNVRVSQCVKEDLRVDEEESGGGEGLEEEEPAIPPSLPDPFVVNLTDMKTNKSTSTRPRSQILFKESDSDPESDATSPEGKKTARKGSFSGRKSSLSGRADGPKMGRAANREAIALARLLEERVEKSEENKVTLMNKVTNVMSSESRETRKMFRCSNVAMFMDAKLKRLQERVHMYQELYLGTEGIDEKRRYGEKMDTLQNEIEECEKKYSNAMDKMMNEDTDVSPELPPENTAAGKALKSAQHNDDGDFEDAVEI